MHRYEIGLTFFQSLLTLVLMVDKMHIAILQENVFLEEKLILLVTKKFISRISKGYKAKRHPHFFLWTVAVPLKTPKTFSNQ